MTTEGKDPAAEIPPVEDAAAGPKTEEAPAEGMNVAQIRDAGFAIDMPWEAPDAKPTRLAYSPAAEGREEWAPPEGFTMGGVAWEDLPEMTPPSGQSTQEPPPNDSMGEPSV